MLLSARLPLRNNREAPFEMNPVETALAARLRRGEASAIAAVYTAVHRPLYRYALAMSGSVELSEEALQETFVQLIRRPENFDPARGQLQGFLFGVMRNVLLKALGRERGEKSNEPLPEESAGIADSHSLPLLEGIEQAERIAAVRAAVLALPPHYREVVVLCDLEELNYDAAALVLACPVGTIRSRLNRARGLLRERLAVFQQGGAK